MAAGAITASAGINIVLINLHCRIDLPNKIARSNIAERPCIAQAEPNAGILPLLWHKIQSMIPVLQPHTSTPLDTSTNTEL